MSEVLIVFYHINKIMMNFYWILYLSLLANHRGNWFGPIMAVMSILFMISNIVYYVPKK